MAKLLTTDEVLRIHYELVKAFEFEQDPIFPPGPRDSNLLSSATARPSTALGKQEKYKTPTSKAAALFHSLVMNHPFHNGNKRTALVSLLVYLDRNKLRLESSDDELFQFVMAVADNSFVQKDEGGARNHDEVTEKIEKWIAGHAKRFGNTIRDMKTDDFLEKCQHIGCRTKKSGDGRSWIVYGLNDDSVTFNVATRSLPGGVVMKYMRKLGLSPSITGIYTDEFQEGMSPEQSFIQRFRAVLKRLAHA